MCTPYAEAQVNARESNSADGDNQIYLVVNLSRGPTGPYGQGISQSAFSIPVKSKEDCMIEGQKITEQNTKEVRAVFWCIQGVKQ